MKARLLRGDSVELETNALTATSDGVVADKDLQLARGTDTRRAGMGSNPLAHFLMEVLAGPGFTSPGLFA
jgi:hypothetical protein